jgi:hypothetical protein
VTSSYSFEVYMEPEWNYGMEEQIGLLEALCERFQERLNTGGPWEIDLHPPEYIKGPHSAKCDSGGVSVYTKNPRGSTVFWMIAADLIDHHSLRVVDTYYDGESV